MTTSGENSDIAPNIDNFNDQDEEVLQYSSQLDLDDDVKGIKINEKIARIVNKSRLQRITQEQAKTIMKGQNKSEIVNINLPKCEQSI